VEGLTTVEKRSDRIVLEANLDYWDNTRLPRLHRIIFDNTLAPKEAVNLVKTSEGRVDLVNELRPLDTLQVAQSPFAQVVKKRRNFVSVFGMFNMRQVDSPWREVRLRQAMNYAINREDFIRYATKGNGVSIPALLPEGAFGYDPDLAPYPFDPGTARQLLREAGYPSGRPVLLIAPEALEVQATVVSKMLEQMGLTVELRLLDARTYNRQTGIGTLKQPPEQPAWDIALTSRFDVYNFPVYTFYWRFALDGPLDWVIEQPELRQLYEQVLHTVVDRAQQERMIRQMERHIHEQAYFLFLYNPIGLYAVNKDVEFVPHPAGYLLLAETVVTAQHWSVRKQKAAVPE
jgi:ABC-type transport system substrate-binding protein